MSHASWGSCPLMGPEHLAYPADLMLGLASALVCASSVLNAIAMSDHWDRYRGLPWRARFVAVNRDHPRLRYTAMVCLMVAVAFLISYAVMLLAAP